jgi:hypothetical protein
MKTVLTFLGFAAIALAACNSHGDYYKVNDMSYVYYKGDGVTKEDAERLGKFLFENSYFDSTHDRSVQLTKTADTFNIKFALDKLKIKDANTEMQFNIYGQAIKAGVFSGKPIKIILADQEFDDVKTIIP